MEFPAIERIEDNYGNAWQRSRDRHSYRLTEVLLSPGALLTVKVTLENPLPEDMYLSFQFGYGKASINQKEAHHTFEITEAQISRSIAVYVRLTRKYRGSFLPHGEDEVQFRYTVRKG